jgi:hypothetical protein
MPCGVAAKLILTASPETITADGVSTSMATAGIYDIINVFMNSATNEVTFGVSGEGALLGMTVGAAAAGQATVKLRSTPNYGTAVVTAASENLAGDDFTVVTSSITLSAPENLVISGTHHSITVSWSPGINNVKYKVEVKMEGGNFTPTEDNYARTSFTRENLKAGTMYWFRVYGYNSEDTLSGYVEGFFMTEPVNELKKDTSELAGTPEEKIEISIPPNTFNEDYYVQISTVAGTKLETIINRDSDIRGGVTGSARELQARTLFGAGISEFNEGVVELRIYYEQKDIEGIVESTLKIYVLNESKNEWEKVGGEVNTKENYVTASLPHFSVYCLMGEPAGAVLAIEEAANYPNPFKDGTVFTFRLTKSADVKLEIFTIAGRLVDKIEAGTLDAGYNEIPAGGSWAGSDLAGGVYLYKITADDGENTISKTAKLVIMR